MLTLAADTSSSQGSLCLAQHAGGQIDVLGEDLWQKQNSHSELITDRLDQLLKKTGVELSQIDFYSVGSGPGSFTGVRVTVNFIRSLAFASERPALVASSLKILAQSALSLSRASSICCLVNAFKNMVYLALYEVQDGKLVETLAPCAQRAARPLQQIVCGCRMAS